MTERNAGRVPMTVGSLSEMSGVSVRTLHHYDEIGLLRPTSRSAAGYRLYTTDDAERLRDILVFRNLGLTLEQVGQLLEAPDDYSVRAFYRAALEAGGRQLGYPAPQPTHGSGSYYAARVEDPDGNCIECGWRH